MKGGDPTRAGHDHEARGTGQRDHRQNGDEVEALAPVAQHPEHQQHERRDHEDDLRQRGLGIGGGEDVRHGRVPDLLAAL